MSLAVGAAAAIIAGLGTWISLEYAAPDALFPPQFAALLASLFGMLIGSLTPQWYGKPHGGAVRRAA